MAPFYPATVVSFYSALDTIVFEKWANLTDDRWGACFFLPIRRPHLKGFGNSL